MEYLIYKLTSPSGKVYIGKTNNYQRRMDEHVNRAATSTLRLHKAIAKHGWDSFAKEILFKAACSSELIYRLEKMYIKQYNSLHRGLNMTEGGGQPHEVALQIAAKKKQNGTTGKGVPKDPKATARMVETRKLRGSFANTEESRLKTQETKKRNGTNKLTENTKQKISQALQIPITQQSKDGTIIREWASGAEASKALGVDRSGISSCLTGKQKTAGGFVWTYSANLKTKSWS